MATRVWTNDDSEFPPLPTLVDFVRAADPRAAVACTGRGKIFHVACDKETRGFENGESILEANKTLAAAADRRLLLAANALTNIAARRAYGSR